MANYKSAKKRIQIAERNRQRNVAIKSRVKTAVKKVLTAIETGNAQDTIETLTKTAISQLDKAQSKGILNHRASARKKSRLMAHVNRSRS